jgi:hypothetical protein
LNSLVTSIKKCSARYLDVDRYAHFAINNATKYTMMRFLIIKFIVAIQAIRLRDSEGPIKQKIKRLLSLHAMRKIIWALWLGMALSIHGSNSRLLSITILNGASKLKMKDKICK